MNPILKALLKFLILKMELYKFQMYKGIILINPGIYTHMQLRTSERLNSVPHDQELS